MSTTQTPTVGQAVTDLDARAQDARAQAAQAQGGAPVSAEALTAADFRAVCSSFVTGVTVVTARSASGVHGSTVNSFTSLSTSPPQIIVCLARTTATLGHVLASGRLAVNILSHDQEDVARVFASKESDKLATVDWSTGMNGAPLLRGAMASLECTVSEVQEQATHMLIVGQVTRAVHEPDAAPLVFFRSAMTAGEALQASALETAARRDALGRIAR